MDGSALIKEMINMKNIRQFTTLLILILSVSLLAGCSLGADKQGDSVKDKLGKIKTENVNDPDEADKPAADEASQPSDKEENEPEPSPEDMYKADAASVFAEMADWSFEFASGAGGWGTELNVKPDGSFSGTYHDSDMGSTGPGHSNGTVYLCDFSGHFSKEVKTAGPLMYSLTIEDMVFDKEPDTEEIIDEVLYSYTTPYGLDGLTGEEDSLVFMAAGAVTSAINEEELNWLSPVHFGSYVGEEFKYIEDKPDELPFAAIINTKDSYAFFSSNISDKNKTFLVNRVKLPGLKNTVSKLNDDGTYRFEDENADSSFKVINTCYPVTDTYDMSNGAEKFVKDCLKHIYGPDAPGDDVLYVTSPNDAYFMQYDYVSICGGYSDYAFWYPDGSGGNSVCNGRFIFSPGTDKGSSYVYAYIIEADNHYPSKTFPDDSFANYWIGSLTFTGRTDGISSAAEGKGAVSMINCDMKAPENDKVSAREIIMVGIDNTELIKKYHLENADFDDDYEVVMPDKNFRDYTLAEGGDTPFYIQYPEDGARRLNYAFELGKYIKKYDDDDSRMMYLYLNEDGEVVYGFEEYTP